MAAAVLIALMMLQPANPQDAAPARPVTPAAPPATGYRIGPGPGDSGTAAAGYRLLPEAPPTLERTGVTIDAYDARRVEGQRRAEDQAYAATVLGGAALAQGRQGPLDGAWTLVDEGGRRLYDVQLADDGETLQPEGAWRDVNAVRKSGFVWVSREAGRTTLRFFGSGGSSPILIELEPSSDGAWRGRLVRDGSSAPVTLRRR